MKPTKLILVGGFLGAGKTTLLFETTKRLLQKGQRIGLITNDQAPGLVDTAWLQHTGVQVAELSGSCFCCNYNGFTDAIQKVQSGGQVDIILAEPVGSCTDLSATILQPLKAGSSQEFWISPLTVLADPLRLANILEGGNARLHPDAAYIYRKQLEESDIILISKIDWFTPEQVQGLVDKVKLQFEKQLVMPVSAKTGSGIQAWLNLLEASRNAGEHIVEVDYDRYAEGEAVLGWLNATISLKGDNIDWKVFANDFLSRICQMTNHMKAAVGHIKIMLDSGSDFLMGNISDTIETLSISGAGLKGNECRLIINARVGLPPDDLEKITKECLEETTGQAIKTELVSWNCLRPGYPTPTFRYANIV